jgi:hypothetical protein
MLWTIKVALEHVILPDDAAHLIAGRVSHEIRNAVGLSYHAKRNRLAVGDSIVPIEGSPGTLP